MGSDLHMNPPSGPIWRIVRGRGYVALYKRGTEPVTDWHRVYLCDDDQEIASNAMGAAMWQIATGRFMLLQRDDLCKPSADEPFAETYPREELDEPDPLVSRRKMLEREIAEIDRQINERKTK